MRILFLTYEPWPTHRADIVVMFGKYLRRLGITTDLVAEAAECGEPGTPSWDGGAVIGRARPQGRAAQHVSKLWLNLKSVLGADKNAYDCIQVRDMSLSALAALIVARVKGLPFVYWLSYLQSEGHIARARARGYRAGLKYWYPLIEGLAGRFIVYKLVLPRADHVFVQSDAMKQRLVEFGIPVSKMTAVPMGVDIETTDRSPDLPPGLRLPEGRRAIIYLGVQDPERRVDILLDMLARVKITEPRVLLVMAGDTSDEAYRVFLREKAARLGVEQDVIWTGWLSQTEAWNYVRSADIGLSPCPRGEILDTGSPTKAVEYMALGLPVVGNDNPDQRLVIETSGAGICAPLDAQAFTDAVISLLRDEDLRADMARRGLAYVRTSRSYAQLASGVAAVYAEVCGLGIENATGEANPLDSCLMQHDRVRATEER